MALNGWDGVFLHVEDQIREALSLQPHVPIVRTDARSREAVKSTLITLVEYVLTVRSAYGRQY